MFLDISIINYGYPSKIGKLKEVIEIKCFEYLGL
jgi:hypothetical protein